MRYFKEKFRVLKQWLKGLIPKKVISWHRRLIYYLEDRQNQKKTLQEIFSDIYGKKRWGANGKKFSSGRGSSESCLVDPYVNKIREDLNVYAQNKPKIVDLGCGNFNVGKNFINYAKEYIAVDIVPEIIKTLRDKNFPGHVKFLNLNIVEDDLPDGDVCFLRQVLQHLSNQDIIKILPKLKKYNTVYITEHYPRDNNRIVPNRDMFSGARIRLYVNSGVYLDLPPFNIDKKALELILEIPTPELKNELAPGVIRTYKLYNTAKL